MNLGLDVRRPRSTPMRSGAQIVSAPSAAAIEHIPRRLGRKVVQPFHGMATYPVSAARAHEVEGPRYEYAHGDHNDGGREP